MKTKYNYNKGKFYLFCNQRSQPFGGEWKNVESFTLTEIRNLLIEYHSIDCSVAGSSLRTMLDFEWGVYTDPKFKNEIDCSRLR